MFKRRRISDLLEQLDRIPLPPPTSKPSKRDLLAEITALWQTDDVRAARPTVRDEIRMALDYYRVLPLRTIPVLYAEVRQALAQEFPHEATPALAELPLLVTFGSWIGGDRDGNPFVTPATTAAALGMARDLSSATTSTAWKTSSSSSAAPPSRSPSPPHSPGSSTATSTRSASPRQHARARPFGRFPNESLRLLVACMMTRLGKRPQAADTNTGGPAPLAPYARASELLADLTILRDTLDQNRGTASPRS